MILKSEEITCAQDIRILLRQQRRERMSRREAGPSRGSRGGRGAGPSRGHVVVLVVVSPAGKKDVSEAVTALIPLPREAERTGGPQQRVKWGKCRLNLARTQ